MLSFGAPFTSPQPRPFPFVSPPLIAPLWSDLNPSNGGTISYRQTSDFEELQTVREKLSREEMVDFIPTHVLVVTWNQVPSAQGLKEVCTDHLISMIVLILFHYCFWLLLFRLTTLFKQ